MNKDRNYGFHEDPLRDQLALLLGLKKMGVDIRERAEALLADVRQQMRGLIGPAYLELLGWEAFIWVDLLDCPANEQVED